MEKIIRKRVFYLGVGPEDEKMKQAAKRFEGRYYRALQSSHGWSFPVSRLAEIRYAIREEAETAGATQTEREETAVSDGATQTEREETAVSAGATQTEREETAVSDGATQTDEPPRVSSDRATQTDDNPVYRYDIDPALSRWIRDRYRK
jgi:hypothetical protein